MVYRDSLGSTPIQQGFPTKDVIISWWCYWGPGVGPRDPLLKKGYIVVKVDGDRHSQKVAICKGL